MLSKGVSRADFDVTTRTAGVRGVFRLDGAPVDARDVQALRLTIEGRSVSAALDGCDPLNPDSIDVFRQDGSITLLIGHVDEIDTLGSRLGMPASAPVAMMAHRALARYGDDLPREMLGGWLLIDWCGQRHRVTIVKSINPSYPLLVARSGPKLALSPELGELAGLSWIDATPTAWAFAASMTSFRMASRTCGATMLPQVVSLAGGRVARHDRSTDRTIAVDPRLPAEAWTGTFEDATVAAEAMVRRIVREQMARTPAIGLELSGGLDSSILAWIMAEERDGGAEIPTFCSAVAASTGLVDEVPYARIVADHLGMPLLPVIPADVSPYLPRPSDFRHSIQPTRIPQHHLNRAFGDAADARDLSCVVNGVLGELTITGSLQTPRPLDRARMVVHMVRSRLAERWPDEAFITWMAPALLQRLPADWIAARRLPDESASRPFASTLWEHPSLLLQLLDLEQHDVVQGRVRNFQPFTDIRLLQLFAGMPDAFAGWDGVNRAMARAMLRGRLPESIRLRPKGPPAVPDFHVRLRRHAAAAAARMPLFRKAGIDAFLDLDRIEASLRNPDKLVRRRGVSAFRTQYGVQVAEYLLWWLSGRPDEMPQV